MNFQAVTLLFLGAGSAAQAGFMEPTQVAVCVDRAPIRYPVSMLPYAKELAGKIFDGIGVHIEWRGLKHCPADGIRISWTQGPHPGEHPGALAYAFPFEGTQIVVLIDRVEQTVAPNTLPHLLGHVLAHEIGHILEGTCRHSRVGILKAHWTLEDYFDMTRGSLSFAAEDVRLIHEGLLGRLVRGPGRDIARAR